MKVSLIKGAKMPYINKKELYRFEKDVFMTALEFSGGLDHTEWRKSAEWLWQFYKGEITKEEFDKGYKEGRYDEIQ